MGLAGLLLLFLGSAGYLLDRRDVNGVRRRKDDPGSLIHSLTASEARQLIAEGVVDAGMIPKVEACLETLERGVRKVHIIDGRLRHSLLLEIYTTSGVGTQISNASGSLMRPMSVVGTNFPSATQLAIHSPGKCLM